MEKSQLLEDTVRTQFSVSGQERKTCGAFEYIAESMLSTYSGSYLTGERYHSEMHLIWLTELIGDERQ
jgi:hypothetical protein